MSPNMLAQALGHSSLVMIQRRYAHSTPADAHAVLAKLLADD
jgi:integrase